jgi:SAM-dependent methyltransferase
MTQKRSKSFDAASFFDENAAQYSRTVYARDAKPADWDLNFIEFIKYNSLRDTLLDIGAGSGQFASLVKINFPGMQVTALDPSVNLLSLIDDRSIRTVVGKIPDLNLQAEERFFFIHISNVLHHLVGKTINESRKTAKESLLVLRDHLDDEGFLMVQEELWESYLVPTASRSLAFHLLSIANTLHIPVPGFFHCDCRSRSFKGLIVCIYSVSELENILKDCGFEIIASKIYPYQNKTRKQERWGKLALLKRWGQVLFIVRSAH